MINFCVGREIDLKMADRVVRDYKREELSTKPIIAPVVYNIDEKNGKDMQILASWEEWFQYKNLPYAVLRSKRGGLEIWKEVER